MMSWSISAWDDRIDDSALPLRGGDVNNLRANIRRALPVKSETFTNSAFICNEVLDPQTGNRVRWNTIARRIGVVPKPCPSWNGYFLTQGDGHAPAKASLSDYYPEDSVMSPQYIDILENTVGKASVAIAYEDYEKGVMSNYLGTSFPVMQDIPESEVRPYVHTSHAGHELLLLSRSDYPSGPIIDYPRVNVMWSAGSSWAGVSSDDGCGIVLFCSEYTSLMKVVEHPELEAFLI